MDEFRKLGLSEKSVAALVKKGFTKPTAIQKLTIPLLLKGDVDVVGKAQTGTGKTACFALPIIERLSEDCADVQAIILAPTRELALQVSKEFESLQGVKQLSVLAVYGGAPMHEQLQRLRRGVQVVVGTPGRVMDLIERKKLHLAHVSFAVLDEADEMLNMGFLEDIETILSHTGREKRMLLFSATMPNEILKIAKKFMRNYEIVEVENRQVTSDRTRQVYYDVRAKDRLEILRRVIDVTPDFHGIVFCKTRVMVDEVTKDLLAANYAAAALHGDISQVQREKTLELFRKRKVIVLVATDVAARGIDVNDLTHVINYSLPQSPEAYVHRVGRTGRAGKQGIAITFVMPTERGKLKGIERVVKHKLIREELPSVSAVLKVKEAGVRETVKKIMERGNIAQYEDISKELLSGHPPQKVVASLLKYIFRAELEEGKYDSVQTPQHDEPRKKPWNNKGGKFKKHTKRGKFKR